MGERFDRLKKALGDAADVDQGTGRVEEIRKGLSEPLPKSLQRHIASAGSAGSMQRRTYRDAPQGPLIPGQRAGKHNGGGTPGTTPPANGSGPKRTR